MVDSRYNTPRGRHLRDPPLQSAFSTLLLEGLNVAWSSPRSSLKHGDPMAFMALQAPGDDSAHLIYEFERRAYPVRNSLLTIGRDAASHILIREPAVSRNHAELRSEDGKFVLHPCGVNPTSVNGMTLAEPRSLAEGDKVEVGSAILPFPTKRLPLGVAVIEPAGASKR